MALDNSLYDALEKTYFIMKEYLETTVLQREHSPMLMKQEELAALLERLDIEAIEEQSKDIHALHNTLDSIKATVQQVGLDISEISDTVTLTQKVVNDLDVVFTRINKIIV